MESQDKPTPKRRSRRKPTQVEAPRTSKEVEHPPTEKPVLKVETPEPTENKYAPKPKIGANRPPNTVTTVGLGHLTVETIKGLADG